MYCKKCGNPIKETDTWCGACGERVGADSQAGVQSAAEAGRQNSAPSDDGEDNEARHTEFTWNVYDFPKPRKTEDIDLRWTISGLRERAAAEAAAREKQKQEKPEAGNQTGGQASPEQRTEEMNEARRAPAARREAAAGPLPEKRTEADAVRAESVKEIEKFFTFTKKNEEFQRLLDMEYEKLKNQKEGEPYIAPEMTFSGHEKFAEPDVSDAQSELERMILEGTTPVEEADPIEDLLHKKRRTAPVDLEKIQEEARRAQALKLAEEEAAAAREAREVREAREAREARAVREASGASAEEAKAEMEQRLAAEWAKEEQARKEAELKRASAQRGADVGADNQSGETNPHADAEAAKARVEALWQEAEQQEKEAEEMAASSGAAIAYDTAAKNEEETAAAQSDAEKAGVQQEQTEIPVFELPRKHVEDIVTKYRTAAESEQKDRPEPEENSEGQAVPGTNSLTAEHKEIKCGPAAQRGAQTAGQETELQAGQEAARPAAAEGASDTDAAPEAAPGSAALMPEDDGGIFAQQLTEMKKATESFYRQLREEREALKRAEEEAAQRIKLEQDLRAAEIRPEVTTVNQTLAGANAEIQVTVAVKANGGMAPTEQVSVVHAAPNGVNVQGTDQSGAAYYAGMGNPGAAQNAGGTAAGAAANGAGFGTSAGFGTNTGYGSSADYGAGAGYGTGTGCGAPSFVSGSFAAPVPPDTYDTKIIDAEAIEVIKETAKVKNEQKQKLRQAAADADAAKAQAKAEEQKEPPQNLKENFKQAVEEAWHENTLNSLFPVEPGVQEEDGEEEEERRGGRVGKIILIIIAIVLLLEIAALGIKYFAPNSAAAAMVEGTEVKIVEVFSGAVDGVKDFFSGLSGEKDSVSGGGENGDGSGNQAEPGSEGEGTGGEAEKEQPAEPDPAPMADKTALVASQSSRNTNIKSVTASDDLYYMEGRNYKNADINNSKPIENNIWKTPDSGETLYYDREAVGTVIAFDSQWQDYVNNGTKDVINLTKEGSKARRNAETYSRVGKETQSFESLEIGEIRQGKNGFYVWTKEQIKKTSNGKTKAETVTYYWIYQLQPVGDEMKIVAYTSY